nr:MAG TPA: hypothetical protein [Caudoviricetes sp.]
MYSDVYLSFFYVYTVTYIKSDSYMRNTGRQGLIR